MPLNKLRITVTPVFNPAMVDNSVVPYSSLCEALVDTPLALISVITD